MKIAIVHLQETSDLDRNEVHLLAQEIESREHTVALCSQPTESPCAFDAAMIRIPDRSETSLAEEAAWQIWDSGVPFLVDPLQRRIARNKLYTHRLWEMSGVLQPRWSTRSQDLEGPVIAKPFCGGRSEGVTWFADPPADYQEPMLFQQYREPRALWRTIASPYGIVLSYKKVSDEKIIAVSTGAQRQYADPPKELEVISRDMTRALGGGLWGCDVIEDEKGFWALEANLNFGFPFDKGGLLAEEICALLDQARAISMESQEKA